MTDETGLEGDTGESGVPVQPDPALYRPAEKSKSLSAGRLDTDKPLIIAECTVARNESPAGRTTFLRHVV